MSNEEAKGFEFPCAYQVKAMGLHEEDFDLLIVEIIRGECEHIHEGSVSTKPSKTGKYISVLPAFLFF